ncbi:sensor histidine kinase [Methylobacterium sp. WSM2598]|uniref:sensor histidine kinase n=1 Tax=Methylobacterium sp. WSM2598 TaxID=398261 RepID=UPI00037CE749|nr:PAS domain-containing sensor histidine kinase [Methylobacterium sp. WSM2598]
MSSDEPEARDPAKRAPEAPDRREPPPADHGPSLEQRLARATARAARQEELFHELIERCPFGIYIVDADFTIASMNHRSQDGAFRNVRPLIGRPFAEAMRILWPEEVAQEIIGHFRDTLDTGVPFYSRAFYRPRQDVPGTEGYEWELQRTRLPDGRFGVICYYYDSTELRRAQQQIADDQRRLRLMVEELNHRVKNTLAIVQSLALQTFREVEGAGAARSAFEGRLQALSHAHDVLTRVHWRAADLGEIVATAATACGVEGRVSASGPPVALQPRTAVTMAMALHELVTNAIKYGALARDGGEILVAWSVTEDPPRRLLWRWEERGGPPVHPPARRGFGTRMLERALAGELNGRVRMDFRPEGLVCTIDTPLGGELLPAGPGPDAAPL